MLFTPQTEPDDQAKVDENEANHSQGTKEENATNEMDAPQGEQPSHSQAPLRSATSKSSKRTAGQRSLLSGKSSQPHRTRAKAPLGELADSSSYIPMNEGTLMVLPVRCVIVVLISIGFALNFIMRYNIHVLMPAMLNHTPVVRETNDSSQAHRCLDANSENDHDGNWLDETPRTGHRGHMSWDLATRQHVENAFYYGYFSTQLLGGRLAELWHPKYVYGAPMFVAAILTVVSPSAAYTDWQILMGIRTALGAVLGVTYPASFVMLTAWVPRQEINRLMLTAHAGYELGSIALMALTPSVITRIGWESVFYIQGLLVFVWFLVWMSFTTSKPRTHWFMSPDERIFVIECAAVVTAVRKDRLPCRRMLTSLPLWSYWIGYAGFCWIYYSTLTDVPQYYDETFGHKSWSHMLLDLMPALIKWLSILVCGVVSDKLIARRDLSQLTIVRAAVIVSSALPAILVLILSFLGCRRTAVQSLIASSIIVQGAGFLLCVLPESLSPNFPGTITGVANTLGALACLFGPIIRMEVIGSSDAVQQWHAYFIATAVGCTVSSLAFVVGASAEEQLWNAPPSSADASRNQVTADHHTDAEQKDSTAV